MYHDRLDSIVDVNDAIDWQTMMIDWMMMEPIDPLYRWLSLSMIQSNVIMFQNHALDDNKVAAVVVVAVVLMVIVDLVHSVDDKH